MTAALRPFLNPKLRSAIISVRAELEQVIDEVNRDVLLFAGQSKAAKDKARTVLANFRQFIEDNKDEIEALRILYSRPYRAGLRYGQVKELAEALKAPAGGRAAGAALAGLRTRRAGQSRRRRRPAVGRCRGPGAARPGPELAAGPRRRDGRTALRGVAARQAAAGLTYTVEQRKWLDAIKDHIASSLRIEQDDFDDVPFSTLGGLGKAYELFGEQLGQILEAMNEGLAA